MTVPIYLLRMRSQKGNVGARELVASRIGGSDSSFPVREAFCCSLKHGRRTRRQADRVPMAGLTCDVRAEPRDGGDFVVFLDSPPRQ